MLARIVPVDGSRFENDDDIDNSLPQVPGLPANPIVLPPLVGIYPPPGMPNLPVNIPVDPGFGVGMPVRPSQPIFIQIPGTPEHPINLPPGIYPPLPPTSTGKVAVLVWVVGVGYRWAVVDTSVSAGTPLPGTPAHPSQGLPPTAQPKS